MSRRPTSTRSSSASSPAAPDDPTSRKARPTRTRSGAALRVRSSLFPLPLFPAPPQRPAHSLRPRQQSSRRRSSSARGEARTSFSASTSPSLRSTTSSLPRCAATRCVLPDGARCPFAPDPARTPSPRAGDRRRASLQQGRRQGPRQMVPCRCVTVPHHEHEHAAATCRPDSSRLQRPPRTASSRPSSSSPTSLTTSTASSRPAFPPASSTSPPTASSSPTRAATPSVARCCGITSSRTRSSSGACATTLSVRRLSRSRSLAPSLLLSVLEGVVRRQLTLVLPVQSTSSRPASTPRRNSYPRLCMSFSASCARFVERFPQRRGEMQKSLLADQVTISRALSYRYSWSKARTARSMFRHLLRRMLPSRKTPQLLL